MESFSQRLIKLKESVGLTTKSLAMLLGMSEMGVQCLEEEYNPPTVKTLVRLSEIFNVSLEYVAMFSEVPKVNEDSTVKEIYVLDHLHNMTKDDILGTMYMDKADMHGKEYYGLKIKDDSMSRVRIFTGDKLIVCRQSYASSGDIVVALLPTGEEVVRRYTRVGNIVTLTPESDNPKYKAVKIDITEAPLVIIGTAREIRIKLK
ncbi:MAG: helix-turn-helix domain-containing protein [Clostridia bacterium]|nr:helix-turn-helix domain-containing protein [Clostridia bacterium]